MGGVSWSELVVIAVVALVVLGPKDMTRMFRMMGEFTGKARSMAREFQRAMNAAADEAGVADVTKTLRDTASGKTLRDAVGFDEIAREFRDIGHGSKPKAAKSTAAKPAAGQAAPGQAAPGQAAAEQATAEPAAAGKAPDEDVAVRNTATAATDAQRLKHAQRAEEARLRAAEIRARRSAAAQAEAAPAEIPEAGADADPGAAEPRS